MSATEQLASAGKAIEASVIEYDKRYPDFVNVVSAFSVTQPVVVGLQPMHHRRTSQIACVQPLLASLQLSGVCFSLAALHLSTPVEQIITPGNDYLIGMAEDKAPLCDGHAVTNFAIVRPRAVSELVSSSWLCCNYQRHSSPCP